nr:hypothetical protein CFP56_78084 [Quercus suber]
MDVTYVRTQCWVVEGSPEHEAKDGRTTPLTNDTHRKHPRKTTNAIGKRRCSNLRKVVIWPHDLLLPTGMIVDQSFRKCVVSWHNWSLMYFFTAPPVAPRSSRSFCLNFTTKVTTIDHLNIVALPHSACHFCSRVIFHRSGGDPRG